jgi:hypothetical protein
MKPLRPSRVQAERTGCALAGGMLPNAIKQTNSNNGAIRCM